MRIKMGKNRSPSVIWALRQPDKYPNGVVYTCACDAIAIEISNKPAAFTRIEISRRDARLLAKRINQCLDATVKR